MVRNVAKACGLKPNSRTRSKQKESDTIWTWKVVLEIFTLSRLTLSICPTWLVGKHPGIEEVGVSCVARRWQLLTLASVANRLPAMCFLWSPKRWKSLDPRLPTGLVTGYGRVTWRLWTTRYNPDLAPSDYRLFGSLKKHLAGKWFAADVDMKQATGSWGWFLLPRDRAGVSATVGQVHKCQWWLCGGLMGTICYSCFVYTGRCT
jgi:hypothetical protein